MLLTEKLTAIADAIRVQSGKTGKLTLDQMPSEIVDLQSLGFEVVGGTTAPTNPKENTIWVNTDAEITSWVFSATEPEAPAAGMVWISTGTSSRVTFNALKKNNITVYPMLPKQYVSGAWEDKEAKSYQGGAWVDWYNGELYKGGNQYENITGGWKKSALEWSGLPTNGSISYGEYLTVKANAGGYYDATTVNALDLTEYSQLLFDIAPDSATDEQLIVVHQRTSGIIWNGTPAWIAASNNGVLPLTGISGLYYISVLAMNNKTIKVGNIRLVK